jgi:hypothetical protein
MAVIYVAEIFEISGVCEGVKVCDLGVRVIVKYKPDKRRSYKSGAAGHEIFSHSCLRSLFDL